MLNLTSIVKSVNKRDDLVVSKKVKKILIQFAENAHEIDKSKPISYYYSLFFERYMEKFDSVKQKKEFFKDNVIFI